MFSRERHLKLIELENGHVRLQDDDSECDIDMYAVMSGTFVTNDSEVRVYRTGDSEYLFTSEIPIARGVIELERLRIIPLKNVAEFATEKFAITPVEKAAEFPKPYYMNGKLYLGSKCIDMYDATAASISNVVHIVNGGNDKTYVRLSDGSIYIGEERVPTDHNTTAVISRFNSAQFYMFMPLFLEPGTPEYNDFSRISADFLSEKMRIFEWDHSILLELFREE